jgi:hypothetical protein
VYSSLAEAIFMVAESRNDEAALEKIMANSGVHVTSEDVDAVARALARIRIALAKLLLSTPFDETIERFYLLLESDRVGEGPR